MLGLLSIIIVNGKTGNNETESLEPTMVEQKNKLLRNYGITLKIVEKFFELNSEPKLRAFDAHVFELLSAKATSRLW